METNSKVYIQTDEQGRIIRCEGGYSMSNITDVSAWTLIDEGTGDKYNLCQSHYFDGDLYTANGIPRYRWDGSAVVERTDAEIEADCVAIVAEQERRQRIADLKDKLSATDYVVIKIAEGAATVDEYTDVIAQRQAWRAEINQLEDTAPP